MFSTDLNSKEANINEKTSRGLRSQILYFWVTNKRGVVLINGDVETLGKIK